MPAYPDRPSPEPKTSSHALLHLNSTSALIVRRLFYEDLHTQSRHPYSSTISALAQNPQLVGGLPRPSFVICAEDFFEDKPVIAATLQPRTQQKYSTALENFRTSPCANLSCDLLTDHCLCLYIQNAFTRNPTLGNRQEMFNLICIILIIYPSLWGANSGLSKSCISGWRAQKPASSSSPCGKDKVRAVAWSLLSSEYITAAATVKTTFFACLQVSGALALRIEGQKILRSPATFASHHTVAIWPVSTSVSQKPRDIQGACNF